MSGEHALRLVLADVQPLISLADGRARAWLLAFKADVRIVLTDIVDYEATRRTTDLPDGQVIRRLLHDQAHCVEVLPTTVGSLVLAQLRRNEQAGLPTALPKDAGELSVTAFVISLRTTNPEVATLVIVEDDWFAMNTFALPGNVHLLSTSAWMDACSRFGAQA